MQAAIPFVIVIFLVLAIVFAIVLFGRLNNLEHHLEKVVLLLTVLANKQGATQDDINNASQDSVSQTPKAEAAKKSSKKK